MQAAITIGANLHGADLSGADLNGANLSGANLAARTWRREPVRRGPARREPVRREPVRREPARANLRGANLYGANLTRRGPARREPVRREPVRREPVRREPERRGPARREPVGANLYGANNLPEITAAQLSILPEGVFFGWKKCQNQVIVKLLIPHNVRRSNATGRKCRAESVKVLQVFGADEGISQHDSKVIYRKGETVTCDSWNEDRWAECGGGIHFFITRKEAELY